MEDPGSIPGRGAFLFCSEFFFFSPLCKPPPFVFTSYSYFYSDCITLLKSSFAFHYMSNSRSNNNSISFFKSACQKFIKREILGSIVVSISACHVEDPGSIPGRGAFFLFVSVTRKTYRPGSFFLFVSVTRKTRVQFPAGELCFFCLFFFSFCLVAKRFPT